MTQQTASSAEREKEYLILVSEGDFEAAAAIRSEINEALKAEARTEAAQEIRIEGLVKEQLREFNGAVAKVLAEYPFLDQDGEGADPAAIAECVEWRDHYIQHKGMTPAAALRKAAERAAASRSSATDEDADPDQAPARRRERPVTHRDVEEMSEEDFEQLSDADIRRLRGD